MAWGSSMHLIKPQRVRFRNLQLILRTFWTGTSSIWAALARLRCLHSSFQSKGSIQNLSKRYDLISASGRTFFISSQPAPRTTLLSFSLGNSGIQTELESARSSSWSDFKVLRNKIQCRRTRYSRSSSQRSSSEKESPRNKSTNDLLSRSSFLKQN